MVFNGTGVPGTETWIDCGQCIFCRLKKAREWGHRCCHEASLYHENSFVTLTYGEENLIWANDRPTLYHRDIQLFFKNYRKYLQGKEIRYFMCGEYGEKFLRPHYHLCIFNHDFADKQIIKKSGDYYLYTSDELLEFWPYGHHTIGEMSFDTACYTARYTFKKVTGKGKDAHYGTYTDTDGSTKYILKPEYSTQSRKRGIGRDWFEMYKDDLYNYDICVTKPTFIGKPPRYYDRLLSVQDPDRYAAIKTARLNKVSGTPDFKELQRLMLVDEEKQKRLHRFYENGLTIPYHYHNVNHNGNHV